MRDHGFRMCQNISFGFVPRQRSQDTRQGMGAKKSIKCRRSGNSENQEPDFFSEASYSENSERLPPFFVEHLISVFFHIVSLLMLPKAHTDTCFDFFCEWFGLKALTVHVLSIALSSRPSYPIHLCCMLLHLFIHRVLEQQTFPNT